MTPRVRVVLLAVAALVATVLAPGPGLARAARPALLPACVYGVAGRGLDGFERRVEQDAWRYADGLAGVTSSERLTAARVHAAAEAAYVWGLPLTNLHDFLRVIPVRNTVVSVGSTATAASRNVVSPNVDTLYSVASISLLQGPLVLDVPDTHGRYYVQQLMDAYTNSFAYVGSGETGTRAGSFVIVPPGWTGTLPDGVPVLRSPTNTVWLLGRTLVDGPRDAEAVKPLLRGYRLTPLPAWRLGVRGSSLVIDKQPAREKPEPPTGTDFIATLNRELTVDPPPAAQRCALDALAPAGVAAPHASLAAATLADAANQLGNARGSSAATPANEAVRAGTRAAVRLIAAAGDRFQSVTSRGRHGWSMVTDPWFGDFGTRYLGRAIVATDYLGANVPRVAIYPTSYVDGRGRPLSGKQRYTITFRRGQLPPVGAFWSLTMYAGDNFLVANRIDRYAIGDRTAGLRRGRDGSLRLVIQHDPPRSAAARANWLPAPAGPFHLILRMYQPRKRVLAGRWTVPPVARRG